MFSTMLVSIFMYSTLVSAAENSFTDGTALEIFSDSESGINQTNTEMVQSEGTIEPSIENLSITPEGLHAFNRNYLNGVATASEISLYADVWAIIPTTSGTIIVDSTATVPGAGSYYVRLLQSCLNYLGYNAGSADGIYGPNTESAIRSFQRNNGLSVDGIAGENTWRYLDIRIDTYHADLGPVPF